MRSPSWVQVAVLHTWSAGAIPVLCRSLKSPPVPLGAAPCFLQVVILDKESAIGGAPEILTQHCIPSDRSEDLLVEGT